MVRKPSYAKDLDSISNLNAIVTVASRRCKPPVLSNQEIHFTRSPVSRHCLVTCTLILCFVIGGFLGAAENRTYIIRFYKRFDKNSDGRLEPKEWRSSRSSDAVERAIKDAGLDPNTTISLKTLIDSRLKSSKRPRQDDNDRGYRAKIGHQRLDENVPDWFLKRDQNHDGQVAMAEFADDWTEKIVADFLELDANHDGLITPKEVMEGGEVGEQTSIASNDSKQDGSQPGKEGSSTTESKSSGDNKSAQEDDMKSDKEGSASDIPEAYLSYAKNICKKYDANSDGFLTKDEWSEMSQDPSAADANKDQKIDHVEYARWLTNR